MRRAGLILAAAGAMVLFGAVGEARAQSGKAPPAGDARAQARDSYALDQSQAKQVLELDNKRWGLKLELRPPVTRDMEMKDVEAGAYYKLTPALRLGGAVGLVDKNAPDAAARAREPKPEEVTPKVRLGAIFKW